MTKQANTVAGAQEVTRAFERALEAEGNNVGRGEKLQELQLAVYGMGVRLQESTERAREDAVRDLPDLLRNAQSRVSHDSPVVAAGRQSLERPEMVSPEQAARVVDDMKQRFEEASRAFAPVRELAIGDELRAVHTESDKRYKELLTLNTIADKVDLGIVKERQEDPAPDKSTVWGRVAAVVTEPAWERREESRSNEAAQAEAMRRIAAKEIGEVEQLMLARTIGTAPGTISPAEKLAYERVAEREPAANVAGVPVRDVAQEGERIAEMARDLRLSERVIEKLENDASFSLKLSTIGQSRVIEREKGGRKFKVIQSAK